MSCRMQPNSNSPSINQLINIRVQVRKRNNPKLLKLLNVVILAYSDTRLPKLLRNAVEAGFRPGNPEFNHAVYEASVSGKKKLENNRAAAFAW